MSLKSEDKRSGKPKRPVKDVEITFTITETTEGKLGIRTSIPDHAAGTVALVLANLAMEVMRGTMKDAGHSSQIKESRLQ